MATPPFSAPFEASLKEESQGGKLLAFSDFVVNPRFFCCASGASVGVAKDPVASGEVSAKRVCTGASISVDYDNSWSPSSTIASVDITWGDGQSSLGLPWPSVGPVAHPLGGYVNPGKYTITITVTDLLGAIGIDTIEVKAVDCSTFATIEMYCSLNQVGSPGVWYSNDAGGNWADRSGTVLANTCVYDLKINPFTVPFEPYSPIDNTEFVTLWAATEKGLYFTWDGARTGTSWHLMESFPPELEVTAVQTSNAAWLEVYVLANDTLNNRVWLYRTVDEGYTWASVELVNPAGNYHAQSYGWTHTISMSADGYYVYVAVLDEILEPTLIRVVYDLSAYDEVAGISSGAWGGVQCDYNINTALWIFGNSGVFFSEDDGDNWVDRSPYLNQNSEFRPVLPSAYDPAYIVAIDNDPANLYVPVSFDYGENWTYDPLVTHAFENHCATRGWWDDYLLFEGAQTVPLTHEHLQLSINLGESMWTERSSGLPADAEVTSIQILYEHGDL